MQTHIRCAVLEEKNTSHIFEKQGKTTPKVLEKSLYAYMRRLNAAISRDGKLRDVHENRTTRIQHCRSAVESVKQLPK